jgi:hypothetical protein
LPRGVVALDVTERETRRSLRRGVALLLVPLCLLLLQLPVTRTRTGGVEPTLPALSVAVGSVLLVVAVAYLAVSLGRQVASAADTPF